MRIMESKRLFISQPMTGKTNDQIRSERKEVEDWAVSTGYTPIDSVFEYKDPGVKFKGVFYLGDSLKLLSNADAAYFMNGWNDARGCRLEHEVCVAYGVPVIRD